MLVDKPPIAYNDSFGLWNPKLVDRLVLEHRIFKMIWDVRYGKGCVCKTSDIKGNMFKFHLYQEQGQLDP